MDFFLEQLGNGLSKGSIFALIAVGYTMVYGVIRLINFAHGEFVMVAAFAGYFCLGALPPSAMPMQGYWALGASMALATACAVLTAGVLAVAVERAAYRPIRKAGRIAALLTAIGVSLFLQNFGIQVVGASDRAFMQERQLPRRVSALSLYKPGDIPPADIYVLHEWPDAATDLEIAFRAGEAIKPEDLADLQSQGVHMVFSLCPMTDGLKRWIIISALAACCLFLHCLVRYTAFGRSMRAVSYDIEGAQFMGVNVNRVISLTFFIGAAIGGLGGVLLALFYNTLDPLMGLIPGLKAFIAAVLGGIGSVPGALLGGLLLGVVEDLVVAYGHFELGSTKFNLTTYRDAVAYTVLITILLLRPQGILGRERAQKL
ncbi:MAG TPA: branched-chain amino acid ABC transporter permease [Candidatus Brocadiia bacterium]|nr:branched-chain amino acid ABC transporter permease [Candidatus Brocadiia bacterium]